MGRMYIAALPMLVLLAACNKAPSEDPLITAARQAADRKLATNLFSSWKRVEKQSEGAYWRIKFQPPPDAFGVGAIVWIRKSDNRIVKVLGTQ